MPSASVRMATSENPGRLRMLRIARRTSCMTRSVRCRAAGTIARGKNGQERERVMHLYPLAQLSDADCVDGTAALLPGSAMWGGCIGWCLGRLDADER